MSEHESPNIEQTPWLNADGLAMERLELHLTYHCPEKCLFCSEEHRMQRYSRFPVTWGRVAKTLRIHAQRGVRNVHFTGGEPTIHPRFLDVLRLSQKLGMRTSIGTIGTMLSRPNFAEKVLPFLNEALFSVHGSTAEIHDRLTQRIGSFDTVCTAMRRCIEVQPNFSLFVNIVMTKHNIDDIPNVVRMVQKMGAKLIVISNTTPEGAGFDAYETLAVSLEAIQDIVPKIASEVKTATLRFFGVPMCVLGEYATWSNDLHWSPRVTVEWQDAENAVRFDGIYSWKPDRRREQIPTCQNCNRNTVCMGVFDKYIQLWDPKVLKPYSTTN